MEHEVDEEHEAEVFGHEQAGENEVAGETEALAVGIVAEVPHGGFYCGVSQVKAAGEYLGQVVVGVGLWVVHWDTAPECRGG
jgi:hypothetical protein